MSALFKFLLPWHQNDCAKQQERAERNRQRTIEVLNQVEVVTRRAETVAQAFGVPGSVPLSA